MPGPHVMSGPIYEGVESAHRCNIVPGKAEGNPLTAGPVYPVNAIHKYSGEGSDPSVSMQTGMIGPVYNVLHEHHYREVSTILLLSYFSVQKVLFSLLYMKYYD